MRPLLFACFCVSLLFVRDGLTHEGHNKNQNSNPGVSRQTPDSQNQENRNAPIEEIETTEDRVVTTQPIPMPFSGSIQDHAHNKLVHLPIGLGLAGVLFAFITLKKPEMLTAVRILWLLAALGAVAAYFTGQAQEEPFEDGELHEVVELHENLGIATGISLGVGFLLSMSRRLRGLTTIWAIIVLGIVLVTGYYGGYLAHS
jgi:uncharacterized membrane protein